VRELEAPEPTRVGAGEGAALGVYIGTVSLFFVLVMATNFFGSATYSVVGPYMAEIWPTRLRASGMGLCYGVGISGKILGPLGLAVILGRVTRSNRHLTSRPSGRPSRTLLLGTSSAQLPSG
jgi:MFS family permease